MEGTAFFLECGVGSVECGVWSVEFGVWREEVWGVKGLWVYGLMV